VVVPQATDFEGVRASLRAVAAAVGERAKGEAMIAAFDRRLAELPPARPGPAASAVVYEVGGVVAVGGSLADAVLTAAGLRNMAAEYRRTRSGQVPLELLLARPPDLVVLSGAGRYRTVAADNLRHPALRSLRRGRASIELPWQLLLCGTPHVADAVARLAEARARLEARR
jgi:iron complex transport system substrate-binding protein